jgi:hypothetical protein
MRKPGFNRNDTILLYCVSNHVLLTPGWIRSQMALQTIAAAGEQQARVGDDMGCRPGAATDQQAGIVGVNMQQRALFRRGLHRFNNMFTFG